MSKITQYASASPVSADIVPFVDVDDLTMAASGTTKQTTVANLLAPANIPQLANYAPTGLTGATTPTSYAGGTVSGHPLSGTWTQGQWVVDLSGRIYVCVVGGTPGTWRRVGAMPYQFFLDDYCKGDGQQALVTTVAGSAVINTTPLAAPAAPVPTTAATGGTILAGVYQVVTTFVNRWGETVGSTAGSITTTGSTSTITVPAPAPVGNATGWYAYVSQAGGAAGTATRQQAAGSPSTMEVPLILTAPPTNTGATAPASDTSAPQVFTSTAVDGGKNVMINGGLGSPGAPWIDTILSVQSPTQATLSTNGASQGGNVSQAGCAMVFSSDDRLNIDQCISDAKAYALLHTNFFQVIGSDRIYGLGTGLFQSLPTTAGGPGLQYNTQVRVPVGNPSGMTEKFEPQLLGPGDNAHCVFWVSALPNLNGCTFVSYSLGPNSADPTYGQQSIIGGPLGGTGFNGSNGFANTKPVIKGIQVVAPGWTNSIGIDLLWVGGMRLNGSSQVYAPTTNTGGGINPQFGWVTVSNWQNKIGAGLRTPGGQNNDDCYIESFATEGYTTSIVTQAEHLVITRLATLNTYFGIRFPNLGVHNLTIAQWSCENCSGGIIQNTAGGQLTIDIVFDGENSGPLYDVSDPGGHLDGTLLWSDAFRSPTTPTIVGAANLKVINRMIGAGHMATPPAVPATGVATSGTGLVYRDAWVTIHTGAGVTVSAITIDGTATGLTLAASSTVAVRVASGKAITLTYAGGTPTWDWWLD